MDWDTCNHKKINQLQSEAKRWNLADREPTESTAKRGKKVQPAKRKKKGTGG